MIHLWSSARFPVPLPDGHRFPIAKYALLRNAVLAEGIVDGAHLHEPAAVSREDVLLTHDEAYLTRLERGALPAAEQRRLGFPWSDALVARALRAAGGTCEAAAAALEHGVAMNLAGGTHHAFATHGEGYCVLNDVVIAWRLLRRDGRVSRAAVIDLDVHQGNGTHALCTDDPDIYSFSMHGRRNYPFHKVSGSLDIELDDGTGDAGYLDLLAAALPRVLRDGRPDLVFYLAGADPHEGDALGRLKLTFDGLMRRDRMVLEMCREIGIPVCIVIAGGYGREIRDTVRVHVNTARIANDLG
ncbi:MAG: histone deacetylase family protein [Gemmatimonadaceae bacterium]